VVRRFWRKASASIESTDAGMREGMPAAGEVATGGGFDELFSVGLRQLQTREFEAAAASFAAADAALPPNLRNRHVMAKSRQAAALLGMARWREALAVFDELVADRQTLANFPREQFPDEVASIYWGRAVCLEEVKQPTKARSAVADLIEEVGTGATATQCGYVAQAYLLQARTAEAGGRFDEALKATEAAITQCSGRSEPELTTVRHEAEQAQQALRWRVRPTR
jgi:tetratricopeptide (TPR) repeat protein